jgi:adenosine deaminase
LRLADLHLHLDGSLRESTLRDLAGPLGVEVPDDLHFTPNMGLTGALARFRTTVAVLQNHAALVRVAGEICDDASEIGVSTLEIRFAPRLHGSSIDAAIDAVLEGVAGRAGVILCALYGDPPESVEELARSGARCGAAGIDLAGGPSATHPWSLGEYARAFRLAGELGLGRTVHAGEGRPPDEIRVAIEQLGADRIGHGTTLLHDPSVLELVLERRTMIEACVTSNVHTGAIARSADHPLPRWLELGVRACICSDNTLLSDTNARRETERVRAIPGMTDKLVERAVEHGHAGAFARRT